MEKQIALYTGILGSFISYLVDGIGLATTVLLGMMALDYITGLIAAAYNRKLHSRTGFNGLLRKCYYLLALSSVYLMGYAVPELKFAGDGLAIALIAMEFISITENGTKMNMPMPEPIKNILLIMNEKMNGKEDDLHGK
ncbi:holin family protein [Kurthia sp. Dielmo]|uniref:phage holin family protein n=1 Tax=Kurthia sp. Dielmo TaxID=1033738 RepID=UPI0002EAF14E|nr:phage holin family protein [Kurthia sp. Dielmo]